MILAAFIVLLAAFVRSVSGFGFALLATPLLTLVFGVKSAVVIVVILSIFGSMLVLFYMRRHVDVKKAAFITLAAIPGALLGAYLLSRLDQSVVKLAIAILIIIFSMLLLLGYSYRFRREALACGIAGFTSGILLTSTSLGGPPIVLFLLNQGLVKERFVGTVAASFLFVGAVGIGTFSSLGMINIALLIKVSILLPGLFLGSYIGAKLLPRIDALLFKKIAISIALVSALIIIVNLLVGF